MNNLMFVLIAGVLKMILEGYVKQIKELEHDFNKLVIKITFVD